MPPSAVRFSVEDQKGLGLGRRADSLGFVPKKRFGNLEFKLAADRYADAGVDVARALRTLERTSVSLQCWQGDDVGGFEQGGGGNGASGLAATGNYPGRARNPDELRGDLEQALAVIPGRHRLALHAMYGEFGRKRVDRDEVAPAHFRGWIDWAKRRGLGLDFNPTCFSHPRAADGFTLASPDRATRVFWIEHCRRAREIGAEMGRRLDTPCVTNIWIPDGWKDTPADRSGPRARLAESLDAVLRKRISPRYNLDSVEPKLFGLGSESGTVGSHEFYLGYAVSRGVLLCIDSGHYHPTESVADKISSVLQFVPEILLHISRGVRWDSDHVVVQNDECLSIAREVVSEGGLLPSPGSVRPRVHLGLDYFDASINRVAAWVIGCRSVLRSLLIALLEPPGIRQAEREGDLTARLALQEEAKTLPWGAIWDHHCDRQGVPPGETWLAEIRRYERAVLSRRDT